MKISARGFRIVLSIPKIGSEKYTFWLLHNIIQPFFVSPQRPHFQVRHLQVGLNVEYYQGAGIVGK